MTELQTHPWAWFGFSVLAGVVIIIALMFFEDDDTD